MKKVILMLLMATGCILANASTATSTLNLSGAVASSCTTGLTSSSLNFTFIPNQTPSADNDNFTISCVNGTVINGMTATSQNGWQMVGNVTGFKIPYTLNTNGYGVMMFIQWSGVTGSTAPVNLLSTNSLVVGSTGVGAPSGSQTMNLTGTNGSNIIPVAVTVQPNKVAYNAPVDTYTDVVVITTSY